MTNKSQQTSYDSNYLPPTQDDLVETFEDTHPSFRLFREKGLDKDKTMRDNQGNPVTVLEKILKEGLFSRLRQFLNNVDLSKGPIERKVVKLERRRDLNLETRKMQESLVTHTEWIAKDRFGNDIVSVEVLEGMYNKPITQTATVGNKLVPQYTNWRAVYDIPFSKEAVDKALDNQINPPELVKYLVRTSQSERDDSYSREQFTDSTFQECIDIHKQGKGLNR